MHVCDIHGASRHICGECAAAEIAGLEASADRCAQANRRLERDRDRLDFYCRLMRHTLEQIAWEPVSEKARSVAREALIDVPSRGQGEQA